MHCCRRGFKIIFKCVQPREMNENWNLLFCFFFWQILKIFWKHTTSLDPISILSPHSSSSFKNKHYIILKYPVWGSEQHVSKVWNKGRVW